MSALEHVNAMIQALSRRVGYSVSQGALENLRNEIMLEQPASIKLDIILRHMGFSQDVIDDLEGCALEELVAKLNRLKPPDSIR